MFKRSPRNAYFWEWLKQNALSSKLGHLKKYIKSQCLFGAFCLKTFSDKDLQGFFGNFEILSAEFNSVKLFKSYSHLKMAIFLKISFFDNFKPPPFVSTCFQLPINFAASSFLYLQLIYGGNLQPSLNFLILQLKITIFEYLVWQCDASYTLQKFILKIRHFFI